MTTHLAWLERDFQTSVVSLAKLHGLLCYHTFDSRRSEPGFPDLVIVGTKGVLYRELKTMTGRVHPQQQKWIRALEQSGADVAVWRPDQWPDAIQAELKAVA